ncbi:hypothetical protein [Angustibacter peucedani]
MESLADHPDRWDDVQRVLSALDDLSAVLGRRGVVHVTDLDDGWTADWEDGDRLEQGPLGAARAEVAAWAARRSDDVRGLDA